MTIANKYKESKMFCDYCGGTDLHIQTWVHANTEELLDEVPNKEPWCETCNSEVTMTYRASNWTSPPLITIPKMTTKHGTVTNIAVLLEFNGAALSDHYNLGELTLELRDEKVVFDSSFSNWTFMAGDEIWDDDSDPSTITSTIVKIYFCIPIEGLKNGQSPLVATMDALSSELKGRLFLEASDDYLWSELNDNMTSAWISPNKSLLLVNDSTGDSSYRLTSNVPLGSKTIEISTT